MNVTVITVISYIVLLLLYVCILYYYKYCTLYREHCHLPLLRSIISNILLYFRITTRDSLIFLPLTLSQTHKDTQFHYDQISWICMCLEIKFTGAKSRELHLIENRIEYEKYNKTVGSIVFKSNQRIKTLA